MTCINTPPRIYGQYRNKSPNAAWYQILRTMGESNICEAANDISLSYAIDSAEGEQLNIIGRIVDASRSYDAVLDFLQYQFNGNEAEQFGADIQFRSKNATMPSSLNDELYRILIKATIAKNNSYAQVDDIVESLIFITGDPAPIITDHGDMSFEIAFSEALSPEAVIMLLNFDVVPRPQSVKLRGFLELPNTGFFGFGQFGESQFGNLY